MDFSQNIIQDISNIFTQNLPSKSSTVFAAAQKAVTSLIPPENDPQPVADFPIAKVKEELAKVALKLDQVGISKADHRFPILVIISIRVGLEKQFGKQTFSVIDSELRNLAISTGRLPEWSARLIYVDDPESTGKAGIGAS